MLKDHGHLYIDLQPSGNAADLQSVQLVWNAALLNQLNFKFLLGVGILLLVKYIFKFETVSHDAFIPSENKPYSSDHGSQAGLGLSSTSRSEATCRSFAAKKSHKSVLASSRLVNPQILSLIPGGTHLDCFRMFSPTAKYFPVRSQYSHKVNIGFQSTVNPQSTHIGVHR